MLDFPRWKIWLVTLTTLVGVLLAVPSLWPSDRLDMLPAPMREARIALGLDLAGGSELLLEADVADVRKAQMAQMDEDIRTAMRRAEPRIEIGEVSTADNVLSFMLRNPADADRARELAYNLTNGVGVTGQRDWNVDIRDSSRVVMTPTEAGVEFKIKQTMEAARGVVMRRIDPDGTKEVAVTLQGSNRIQVQVPGLKDPERLKKQLGETAKLEFKLVDPDQSGVQTGIANPGSELLPYVDEAQPGAKIAVLRRVMVSGEDLIAASQKYDQDGVTPVVDIRFNNKGGKKFAQVSSANVGKQFAIILDGKVISAPVFREAILTGQAQISGSFTVESATDLSTNLQSGKLPVALKVVDERSVGPDLGRESIESGLLAGLIATLVLMAYMIITYMRFGVYTSIALLVNGLLILGLMGLFNATLTLPGIAGFVLTIGAAVDANVLINERIREEQVRGRQTIQAVEFGYKEASTAIFDANITNVISAVIMFSFGSGPIRGFAVVLALGIVTSVFTGVTFTRLLVADYLRRNRPREIVI